ncbi:hypothetical protein Pan44_27000 [Caulifigura coniformis]|uniref:Uncharacterized protein n=1 Tax=Caulifigura coniformis TaxID=2527983 RepID=A0A517SEV3_9PLAN|nr:hypothetical protein [Caulifigura coniformis]QDT54665.1 hypothetical protein Pan44_27000 [Caulifigura coniformis]
MQRSSRRDVLRERRWAHAWVKVCGIIKRYEAAFNDVSCPHFGLLAVLQRAIPRDPGRPRKPTPGRRTRLRGAPAAERNRDIVEMVIRDGMTKEQVAARFGLKPDTVRQYVNRELRKSARKYQK